MLWQDGLVAALAAIGAASMALVLIRAVFFRPPVSGQGGVIVLIPVRGDGSAVEQQVRELMLEHRQRGLVGPVLLVDCGATAEGRRLCELLCREDRRILLCRREDIGDYLN